MNRNVQLYPWHNLFHNLVFWQATWFLYFQSELSAADALLLYVAYDLSVTALEVPSGWMSDRIGRRITLIAAALAYALGLVLLGIGGGFAILLVGQFLLGAARAFVSGTDTALLYQSLVQTGRDAEMEHQTLRAWRFGFVCLGLSAVIGGAMALVSHPLPFFASALALCAALYCAVRFTEPAHDTNEVVSETQRLRHLLTSFRKPILLWLFTLSVLMYGYSHIPFVFGQPFIAEALSAWGWASEAPLVSGIVTALMMGLSVLVSFLAPGLRTRIGLASMLLLAFGIQVGLAGLLALIGSVFGIALLLLRMVPDSISTPFITARIQPLIGDDVRATFMSLRSFIGRLLFASSLWIAAGAATDVGQMPLGEIQAILIWYAYAGLAALAVFALAAIRLPVDDKNQS